MSAPGGDDMINGTEYPETLKPPTGSTTNDTINGPGGNDTLKAGYYPGHDTPNGIDQETSRRFQVLSPIIKGMQR